MAKRNTFGVDETLESTFSWEMIRRCLVYIRREGRLFLRAFVLQALAMVYRRQHSVHHIVQPVRQRHRPEHRP